MPKQIVHRASSRHSVLSTRYSVLSVLFLGITISCAHDRPRMIEEIAHYDTRGWSHDVAVDGNLVYVSDREGGFLIFDRALDFSAPRIMAPVKDVISLAPHAGRPLLASRFEGIVLVSPAGSVESRLVKSDIANAVVSRGDRIYCAYGARGLVIARIRDRELETESELPTPGWSHDVKLWGDRALLADWNYGLRVVDVSRPDDPSEIGVLPTRATAICIALGDWNGQAIAAVAEGHAGVGLVSFDPSGRPSALGRHPLGLNPQARPHPETGGWAHGVALCNGFLFVANWKRGLAILDVRDPQHPRLIDELPTRGTSLGVKAEPASEGRITIFLADGEEGLRVLQFDPSTVKD